TERRARRGGPGARHGPPTAARGDPPARTDGTPDALLLGDDAERRARARAADPEGSGVGRGRAAVDGRREGRAARLLGARREEGRPAVAPPARDALGAGPRVYGDEERRRHPGREAEACGREGRRDAR